MKKISVIIPCYNVGKYLPFFLESILSQTIGIQNLQLIFVEDKSTDNTLQLLKDFEQQHSDNVTLIELQKNSGPAVARNVGLSYADCDYIAFADSDDILHPNLYEVLYTMLSQTECDYSVCQFKHFSEETISLSLLSKSPSATIIDLKDDSQKKVFFLQNSQVSGVWNKLFRREYLTTFDAHFPEGLKFEDIYFNWQMLLCANRVISTSEPLYYYRANPESISNNSSYYTYMMENIEVCAKTLNALIKEGLFSPYYEELFCAWATMSFKISNEILNSPVDEITKINQLKLIKNTSNKYFPNVTSNQYVSASLIKVIT